MNQWINESLNQWTNETMNQWLNDWTNEWIEGWVDEGTTFLCRATYSLSDLFAEAPLFSDTSSLSSLYCLGCFCFEQPPANRQELPAKTCILLGSYQQPPVQNVYRTMTKLRRQHGILGHCTAFKRTSMHRREDETNNHASTQECVDAGRLWW